MRSALDWWNYSESAIWIRFCLLVAAALFALVSFIIWAERRSCADYAKITGRATQYSWRSTCYVQDDKGKWHSMNEWKLRGATKGN